ncbi:hypothetical protein AB0F17_34925 [Nonomuraea sp. NPDC026600]|uniref:hypothetical protein n=1 Tax=Nonomuraea sp. NPDC026600 TaxID=3155363 RepID=UPI0033FC8F9D
MPPNTDDLRALLDGMLDRMPVDVFVDEATRLIMGPLHDHPVLQQIRERRVAALALWVDAAGEAVEQVITGEQAADLRGHFEQLRERAECDSRTRVPPLGPIVPGQQWATVYGVRLLIEDRAPVLGEYIAGSGPDRIKGGMTAIAKQLLPAGTAVHVHGYSYISAHQLRYGIREEVISTAKARLAKILDAPHFVAVLAAEDLQPYAYPAEASRDQEGWRIMYGFTLQAIPGATQFIVFRPGPSLPPGLLRPDRAGCWERRGAVGDLACLQVVHDLGLSRIAGTVSLLTARATGRVEINQDRTAAEVYDVTL